MKQMTVPPTKESIPLVMSFVEDALSEEDVPVKPSMQMQIAVDEIYANIVAYSNASAATVECGCENGCITLRFSDDGVKYDPLSKPDPDITLSAEERDIGGLGIFMVKKSMDSVVYEYLDGRNVLTLKKKYI